MKVTFGVFCLVLLAAQVGYAHPLVTHDVWVAPISLNDCLRMARESLSRRGYTITTSGNYYAYGTHGNATASMFCEDAPSGGSLVSVVVATAGTGTESADSEMLHLESRELLSYVSPSFAAQNSGALMARPPQPAYPPQQPAYPSQQQAYPPQQPNYPPQQSTYRTQQPNYQPTPQGYPAQQQGYPPQQQGYQPPQQQGYPPQQPAYQPPQQQGYPPQQPAYQPPQQQGYPPQQQYPSQASSTYPPQPPNPVTSNTAVRPDAYRGPASWVSKLSSDPIPDVAVRGGTEADGRPQYVCRTRKGDALVPGKAVTMFGTSCYAAERDSSVESRFELLVGAPGDYIWSAYDSSRPPFYTGVEDGVSEGSCRGKLILDDEDKGTHIGKLLGTTVCKVTYKGRIYNLPKFDILYHR